jgi:hypothetical protein
MARPPEFVVVVQQLPRQAGERRADQERPRHRAQVLAQAGRDERTVEDAAAGARLVREAGACGAAQQRIGALLELANRPVVDRLAEFLLERFGGVALGNVERR